jgi:hypothetical protein
VDICQNILAATIPKKVPLSKGKSPMKTVINPRHIAVIIQREISLTGNFHLILSQFRALCHKIQGRTNARIDSRNQTLTTENVQQQTSYYKMRLDLCLFAGHTGNARAEVEIEHVHSQSLSSKTL